MVNATLIPVYFIDKGILFLSSALFLFIDIYFYLIFKYRLLSDNIGIMTLISFTYVVNHSDFRSRELGRKIEYKVKMVRRSQIIQ